MSDSSETKVATAPESDQTAEDAVLENSKQTAEDAAEANTEQADSPRDRADVAARVAEFAPLSDESERAKSATGDAAAGGDSSMDRLLDVSVMVSVELGRVTVAIDEILKLGVGSVLVMVVKAAFGQVCDVQQVFERVLRPQCLDGLALSFSVRFLLRAFNSFR